MGMPSQLWTDGEPSLQYSQSLAELMVQMDIPIPVEDVHTEETQGAEWSEVKLATKQERIRVDKFIRKSKNWERESSSLEDKEVFKYRLAVFRRR